MNTEQHTNPNYKIGYASIKTKLSPESLRLYEKEKLIAPHRTSTGMRLYSQADIDLVLTIHELINQEGLNIAGVKRLLALIPCWDIKNCPETDCTSCEAYKSNSHVCWTLENKGACSNASCSTCTVYAHASNINKLKDNYNIKVKL